VIDGKKQFGQVQHKQNLKMLNMFPTNDRVKKKGKKQRVRSKYNHYDNYDYLTKAEIIELITNNCLENPCRNGMCIDLVNDYRCDCNPGFSGKNCDVNCPVDNPLYYKVDGVCLSFNFYDTKNYADAKKFCETADINGFTTGRLIEPKTQSFYDKVTAKAKVIYRKSYPRNWIWIGINAIRGPWAYTSSQTKLVFENWNKGQPNSKALNVRKCVSFYYGKWYNQPCGSKFHFICEFF